MSLSETDERIQSTTNLEGYINFDLSIMSEETASNSNTKDAQNSTSYQDIIGVVLQALRDLSVDPERRT